MTCIDVVLRKSGSLESSCRKSTPRKSGYRTSGAVSHAVAMTAATVVAFSGSSAYAASPYGTWLRPSTGGKIQAYQCGGGLGLKVTASPTPANIGQIIMCGAKDVGGGRFEGSIKNLDDGQTYSGVVEVNGNTMNLSGCVLGGLICKTDTWKRQ